jgi:hypothetical protein
LTENQLGRQSWAFLISENDHFQPAQPLISRPNSPRTTHPQKKN